MLSLVAFQPTRLNQLDGQLTCEASGLQVNAHLVETEMMFLQQI